MRGFPKIIVLPFYTFFSLPPTPTNFHTEREIKQQHAFIIGVQTCSRDSQTVSSRMDQNADAVTWGTWDLDPCVGGGSPAVRGPPPNSAVRCNSYWWWGCRYALAFIERTTTHHRLSTTTSSWFYYYHYNNINNTSTKRAMIREGTTTAAAAACPLPWHWRRQNRMLSTASTTTWRRDRGTRRERTERAFHYTV